MSNVTKLFARRAQRIRTSLRKNGGGRPRLSVFRSGLHIYAQIIDDAAGATLAQASTIDKSLKGSLKATANIEAAKAAKFSYAIEPNTRFDMLEAEIGAVTRQLIAAEQMRYSAG